MSIYTFCHSTIMRGGNCKPNNTEFIECGTEEFSIEVLCWLKRVKIG